MLVSANDIQIIKTNKFKTISYVFKFIDHYNLEKRLTKMFCGQLFSEYSDKYPTKQLMTLAKDELFNPSISFDINKIAKCEDFTIMFTFLNPKFHEIDIEVFNNFCKEILFKSHFTENQFAEAKRNLLDKISRKLEKPIAKAFNDNIEYLNSYIDFNRYRFDLREEISNFSYGQFLDSFKKIYDDVRTEVVVLGDVDENKSLDFIKSLNLHTKTLEIKIDNIKLDKIIDYEKNIANNQSVVIMNFASPYYYGHEDYHKWLLALAFFGKGPSSLLFKQIREKNSLCYSIGVGEYRYDGLFYCYALIDAGNYDKFIQLCLKQINCILNNEIDIEDFNRTKKMIIQNILSEDDILNNIIHRAFMNKILNSNLTKEILIEIFEKIEFKDIQKIFRNVTASFNYHLKGVDNEKNK